MPDGTKTDGAETALNLLSLDLQVCFPLYAASNLLNRLYRPILSRFGLTYPQYLVMLVLWERQPQSVGELGARLHLDSGTLTPLLKRMAAAGLVSRRRDAEDERRVFIDLTDAGTALRDQVAVVPETLGKNLNLSPELLDLLRRHVREMVSVLAGHLTKKPA